MIENRIANFLALLFIGLITLSLVSCGGGGNGNSTSNTTASVARFAGNYSGTYSGSGVSGTWSATVDNQGNITGTAGDSSGSIHLTGNVTATGQLSMTSPDASFGGSASGSIDANGNFNANWTTATPPGNTITISGTRASSVATSTLTGTVLVNKSTAVSKAAVVLWASDPQQGAVAIGKSTSDSNGQFTISYSNPANSDVLYVTAYQGNVGSASNNTALQLAASVGVASSLATTTDITLNELSTVAFAQVFGRSYTANGLQNATATQASTVRALVNTNGQMQTQDGTMIPSLNWQADILASCSLSVSNCTTLQTASSASDVFLSLVSWAIANNSVDWKTLGTLVSSTPPYDSTTFPVATSLHGFAQPLTITLNNSTLNKALSQPQGIAIDTQCNVWVGSNANPGYVSEINLASQKVVGLVSGTLGQPMSFNKPNTLASDSQGNVWILDGNQNVALYSQNAVQTPWSTGPYSTIASVQGSGAIGIWGTTPGSPAQLVNNQAAAPFNPSLSIKTLGVSIAADTSGKFVYVADNDKSISQYSTNPLALVSSYNTLPSATGVITVDSNDHVWGLMASSSTMFYLDFSASSTPSSFYASVPLPNSMKTLTASTEQVSMAIDGNNNVWFVDSAFDNVFEYLPSSKNWSVFNLPSGSGPVNLAIDVWGDVWVVDNNSNAVTVMPGAAVPVGSCKPTGVTTALGGSVSVPTQDVNWNPASTQNLTPVSNSSSTATPTGNTNNYWYWWGWNFMLS